MNKAMTVVAGLVVVGAGAWFLTQSQKTQAEITADELAGHIRILASDDFEGRAPATQGEVKTIDYLAKQFQEAGVVPALGDSYFQAVPMVELTAQNISPLRIQGKGQEIMLAADSDMVVWTKRVVEDVMLNASDMIFAGYGINAPEYQWNDYEGLDVQGKTVVILVNDPGFATQDSQLFNGKTMTYYGRWTYKYEEAARQGAAAAIIIHQTAPAAYPWSVVQSSWTGAQLDLERPDGNAGRALVEGWVSEAGARQIFEAAGLDFDAASDSAKSREFTPVELGLQASVSFGNAIRKSNSHNVIGIVEGTENPGDAVLYMAHWDHLGRGAPDETGDEIYNGAVDNASGISALLEIGQKFAADRPKRSVVLIAVTGEESGLLGSAFYAENPIVPLNKTVAGLNMDSLNVIGPVNDIVVVGQGKSELEEILARQAKAQGRVIRPEPTPERGYFYRSDHFSMAKVGVPMLYTESGSDHVEKGREWGEIAAEAYVANDYHQQSDEFHEDWDLRGAVQDADLLYAIGRELADGVMWPNWYESAEFRATRDAIMAK